MIPNRQITNECTGLGFYSVHSDADRLMSFFNDLVTWFRAVGCPPDKLSVHGPGFGGKLVGFSKTNARLSKQGFSGVKGLTIIAMLPDGTMPALDWWAVASLDLGIGLRPYFALAARSSVTTLEDDLLTQLAGSCLASLTPAYGIGFYRNHDHGPWFYSVGMNYGSPIQQTPGEYEEALTISRWGDLAVVNEVYKQGILRDVYPHSYLTESHLSNRIAGQTLEGWISSDSSRGTLASLDNRMTLWKVAAPQNTPIREVLWSAGMIFDWKLYLHE